jgi:hypothetical protein
LLAGTAALLAGATIAPSAAAVTVPTRSDAPLLAFCAEYHRALAAMAEFYATAPEPSWDSEAAHEAWDIEQGCLHTRQSSAYAKACGTPAHTLKGIFAKARVLAAEAECSTINKEDVSQLLEDLVAMGGRA